MTLVSDPGGSNARTFKRRSTNPHGPHPCDRRRRSPDGSVQDRPLQRGRSYLREVRRGYGRRMLQEGAPAGQALRPGRQLLRDVPRRGPHSQQVTAPPRRRSALPGDSWATAKGIFLREHAFGCCATLDIRYNLGRGNEWNQGKTQIALFLMRCA